MENYIWITHHFEGFHRYPNAPDCVDYLKHKHRHIFKIKIWIEVRHNEREIEFHMFKNFIKEIFKSHDFNNKSCEMISDNIYEKIIDKYPSRKIKIEVSEDGENGSFKTY